MTKASMTRATVKFNTAKFPKRSEKNHTDSLVKPLVSARHGKAEVMSRF
jgi:hypothetical protein